MSKAHEQKQNGLRKEVTRKHYALSNKKDYKVTLKQIWHKGGIVD